MVLPSKVSPLSPAVPIVNDDGTPTAYFVRQLELLLGEKAITDNLASGAVQDSDLVEILEALELDDLADVDTTTTAPTNGQALTWNNTSGLWVPGTGGGNGGGNPYEAPPVPPSPAVSDFTWTNQGTATATASTGGGFVMAVGTPGISIHGLEKTPPSTPFTFYVNMRDLGYVRNNSNQFGITLRNTTSSRLIYLCFNDTAATDDRRLILIQRWTNQTTFSATAVTLATWTDIHWLKVTVSSTTITFDVSSSGLDWINVGTETIATFLTATGGTLDKIGVGICANANPMAVWVTSWGFTQPSPSPTSIPVTLGLIYESTTPVGVAANTTEQVLQSCTLPANTLANGKALRIRVEGTVIGSARTKTCRLNFGSTSLVLFGTSTSTAVQYWVDVSIKCTGSTAEVIAGNGAFGPSTGAGTAHFLIRTTSAEDVTTPLTMQITGQTTATAVANDIVCDLFRIEVL